VVTWFLNEKKRRRKIKRKTWLPLGMAEKVYCRYEGEAEVETSGRVQSKLDPELCPVGRCGRREERTRRREGRRNKAG